MRRNLLVSKWERLSRLAEPAPVGEQLQNTFCGRECVFPIINLYSRGVFVVKRARPLQRR